MLNWIKCGDDLPAVHQDVLVFIPRRFCVNKFRDEWAYAIAVRQEDGDFYDSFTGEYAGVPSHWARINTPSE
jgi:hypothetical protein